MIQRQASFLAKPEWKSVPWAKAPEQKSSLNKLLDVLTEIPGIIEGVWQVMDDRVSYLTSHRTGQRKERPDTVARLQARVKVVETELEAWLIMWQADNPDTAPQIMEWAFDRANGGSYRPGIDGVEGPDVYDANMMESFLRDFDFSNRGTANNSGSIFGMGGPFELLSTSTGYGSQPSSDETTFAHMQDVALYTTVMVWTNRLARYLNAAARNPEGTDFFTAPFHTSCTCCNTVPQTVCETIPPPELSHNIEPTMGWNVNAVKMAVAPMRLIGPDDELYLELPPPVKAPSPPVEEDEQQQLLQCIKMEPESEQVSMADELLPLVRPTASAVEGSTVLLPGDVRFASQLRVLSWLVERLPASRPHVLGTLAAIGLGHCGHDVRPAEGIKEVADAVNRVLDSTRIEGANDILLKSYKPAVKQGSPPP